MDNPALRLKSLGLVRNMLIAAVEERYKDASIYKDAVLEKCKNNLEKDALCFERLETTVQGRYAGKIGLILQDAGNQASSTATVGVRECVGKGADLWMIDVDVQQKGSVLELEDRNLFIRNLVD